MLGDFFVNACILVTFLSVFYNYYNKKDGMPGASISSKLLTGIYCGTAGIVLMLFSVHAGQDIILDFRYLPILLATIYIGIVPSIIASIMIGFFRVLYFGISKPAIIAVVVAVLTAFGSGSISFIKTTRKNKWIYSVTVMCILISIGLSLIIEDKMMFFRITTLYCLANVFISCFVFVYSEFLMESVQLNKRLKNEATIDHLTGLNNLRQFDKAFNCAVQQCLRKGQSLSLLYVDIDFFKKINDTYGHSSGDIILEKFAEILENSFRGFDIISRIGGEEFSVILTDCQPSYAVKSAERLRKRVKECKFHISDKESISITVSIGVSTFPDITENIDDLIENADTALYEAKRTGRNKVVLYRDYNPENRVQIEGSYN